ncbi:hypothetical protein BC831DRAFT_476553 [Entophlyctis helioformis]|nr:hypothetical protein BC831DRAFT_476553 [Entophlyctis helioformis]
MINQFKEALADCRTAIRIDPNFTKAHFRAAKCQVHLGELDDALSQLREVEKLGSVKSKVKVTDLAETLAKEVRDVVALQSLLQAYHKAVDSLEFRKALTSIEAASSLVDPTLRATGLNTSVSSIDSHKMTKISLKWQFFRAHALIGCWDIDEAMRFAYMVLGKDGRNPDALVLRARTMHLNDSHPTTTVIQYLTQALAFDPDHKDARTLLKKVRLLENIKKEGNDAFARSDLSAALETYSKYLEEDPTGGVIRVKVMSNRATVLSKQGKHKEAAKDAEAALDHLDLLCFPKTASLSAFASTQAGGDVSNDDRRASTHSALFYKLYLRRADSFMKLEQYEDALRDYKSASAIKPEDREVKQAIQTAQRLYTASKRKNYYKILGCEKTASDTEIKKAYRKMALVYHPDKQVGLSEEERVVAEAKFKEIGEAYAVLSDERKKQMYDAGHDIDGSSASGGPGASGFGGGSASMNDIFAAMFAQQQRGGGGGGFGGFGGGGFAFGDDDDDDESSGYGHSYHGHSHGHGRGGAQSRYQQYQQQTRGNRSSFHFG